MNRILPLQILGARRPQGFDVPYANPVCAGTTRAETSPRNYERICGGLNSNPISSLFQAPAVTNPSLRVSPPPFNWLRFAIYFARNISRADLNCEHLAFGNWRSQCRRGENTPRNAPNFQCTIDTPGDHTVGAHFEIRPIEGRASESIVSRGTIRYQEPIYYRVPVLPNLPIVGFSIVDAPEMQVDQRFQSARPILWRGEADYSYQNPFINLRYGEAWNTSFYSSVPPPPSNSFTLRFQPDYESSGISQAEDWMATQQLQNGEPLLFWDFMVGLGLTDPEIYRRMGIHYLSLPRNLGDLIELFSQVNTENAPYVNPNMYRQLPNGTWVEMADDDPNNYGPAMDWTASYLTHHRQFLIQKVENWVDRQLRNQTISDPAQIQARRRELFGRKLPMIHFHFALRSDRYDLPGGNIAVPAQEMMLQFQVEPLFDAQTGQWTVRNGTQRRITLESAFRSRSAAGAQLQTHPLNFGALNFTLGSTHISASSFQVGKVEYVDQVEPEVNSSIHHPSVLKLSNLRLRGAHIESPLFPYQLQGGELLIDEVRVIFEENKTRVEIGSPQTQLGIRLRNAQIVYTQSPLSVNVTVSQFQIPQFIYENGREVENGRNYFSVQIPNLNFSGNSHAQLAELFNLLNVSGQSRLENFSFYARETAASEPEGWHLNTQGHYSARFASQAEAAPNLDFNFNYSQRVCVHNPALNGDSQFLVDARLRQFRLEDLHMIQGLPIPWENLVLQPSFQRGELGNLHVVANQDRIDITPIDSAHPIEVEGALGRSSFNHFPNFTAAERQTYPSGALAGIHTQIHVEEASCEASFNGAHFVRDPSQRGLHYVMENLNTGAIDFQNIQGDQTQIWINMPIFAWVMGNFQSFNGAPLDTSRRPFPNIRSELMETLQRHPRLLAELLTSLNRPSTDSSNFFHLDGVFVDRVRNPQGQLGHLVQICGLRTYVHEDHTQQYAVAGIPLLAFFIGPNGPEVIRDVSLSDGRHNVYSLFLDARARGGAAAISTPPNVHYQTQNACGTSLPAGYFRVQR